MPVIAGTDLILRVKDHGAELPILVLSMHNEPQVATRMLKAGATGYITKDCEPELLEKLNLSSVADLMRYAMHHNLLG